MNDLSAAFVAGPVVDLAALTPREAEIFLAGMLSGYLQGEGTGYARGHQDAQDELAAIQRRAARIVHAMARLPPHAVRGSEADAR